MRRSQRRGRRRRPKGAWPRTRVSCRPSRGRVRSGVRQAIGCGNLRRRCARCGMVTPQGCCGGRGCTICRTVIGCVSVHRRRDGRMNGSRRARIRRGRVIASWPTPNLRCLRGRNLRRWRRTPCAAGVGVPGTAARIDSAGLCRRRRWIRAWRWISRLGKSSAPCGQSQQERQAVCTNESPSGHVACPSLEVCSRDDKTRTAR